MRHVMQRQTPHIQAPFGQHGTSKTLTYCIMLRFVLPIGNLGLKRENSERPDLRCFWNFELETGKVISGWILTRENTHSRWHYIAAPPWNQAASIHYPTQSHYPNLELTSPCPILLILSSKLGSGNYQFDNLLVWHDWEQNCWSPTREASALMNLPTAPSQNDIKKRVSV